VKGVSEDSGSSIEGRKGVSEDAVKGVSKDSETIEDRKESEQGWWKYLRQCREWKDEEDSEGSKDGKTIDDSVGSKDG